MSCSARVSTSNLDVNHVINCFLYFFTCEDLEGDCRQAMICTSQAGFHQMSIRNTWDAAVKLRATPATDQYQSGLYTQQLSLCRIVPISCLVQQRNTAHSNPHTDTNSASTGVRSELIIRFDQWDTLVILSAPSGIAQEYMGTYRQPWDSSGRLWPPGPLRMSGSSHRAGPWSCFPWARRTSHPPGMIHTNCISTKYM